MKAIALFAGLSFAALGQVMPVAQQNALVQTYCAVCHEDAHKNGGLSLQHFDAAKPDPGVVAMMLSKIKTGALGAAGLGIPDKATETAWVSAFTEEAKGADRWFVDLQPQMVTAGIVRALPSSVGPEPDSFRLTVSCRTDSNQPEMQLAWAPAELKDGQFPSASVDGKTPVMFKVEGKESMGNGAKGSSGPGSILFKLPLPSRSLTVSNMFPNETVEFPFSELPQAARQALSGCFSNSPGAY